MKQTSESDLNVYQVLVREYLSIETPYRGLLVYHGLGTGKTATAVSMAEKASSDMKITTLLPASLESNFIGEVKRWGKNELDIEGVVIGLSYLLRKYKKMIKLEKNYMMLMVLQMKY